MLECKLAKNNVIIYFYEKVNIYGQSNVKIRSFI